ncbi:hypothetical protein IAU59_000354 [Kwoniella sp. CBS 9459]
MELVSRSESGLEPDWAVDTRDAKVAGSSGLASASASGSSSTTYEGSGPEDHRLRNVSSSSTSTSIPGPSTALPLKRPVTPPPNDENLLDVGSRWAGEDSIVGRDQGQGQGYARGSVGGHSRMIGRSPPPPPGPPPSDPPPLPPASSHPFATATSGSNSASASSSRPRPSARLSSLSSIRKASLTSSRPSSPAGPPPLGDLPPLPTQAYSRSGPSPNPNVTPAEGTGAPSSLPVSASASSAEGGRPSHSRKVSDTPPQVSPRSSSLFMSQQAGPSNTGAGPLSTPIALSGTQAGTSSQIPPSRPNDEFSSSSSTSRAQPTAPTIPAAPSSESSRISNPIPQPHSHTTTTSTKPPRTPSRHLLQTALDLAQRAVEMDKNNDVVGALAAYREAVNRLKAVMERVGVEPSGDRRRRSGTGKSEEEGRTLRGIHDAYVARIQLLSSYEGGPQPNNDNAVLGPSSSASDVSPPVPATQRPRSPHPGASSTSTLVPPSNSQNSLSDEGTPRPSLDDGGMTGIGNLMLSDPGDQSLDTSMASPPRRQQPVLSSGSSERYSSDPRAGGVAGEIASQPSISGRLDQTGSSSPTIPVPNGPTHGHEMSLQQALDRAADASSQTHSAVPSRQVSSQPRRSSNASIGLGYPTSPPSNMTHSSASSSTPSKVGAVAQGHPQSDDGHGSPSSSKLRLKRPARPSLGLEMETDLSGIDGVDEEMEVLARTPRETFMPASLGNGPGSDPSKSLTRSTSREPDSPHSMNSTSNDNYRPLPPLPDSAPLLDASGQPMIKTRIASLSGASVSLRPGSGSSTGTGTGSMGIGGEFLVSPTTSQGTISQRRQSRPISGNMSAALEQMQAQGQQLFQNELIHQRLSTQLPNQARGDTNSAFPVSSSSSSIRSTSASSIGAGAGVAGTRVRAKSQPGNRPSIQGGDLPPVPPATLRHKASFSSSSQLGTGVIPQIQRHSVSPNPGSDARTYPASGGLRINTDHSHGGGSSGSGLAPPINIASRSGSPRSLPPLPDTAVGSNLSTGAGSLISPLPEAQPMEGIHRPFHLLRILHASMDPDSSGSYLTGAIHISSAVWNPSNWSKFPSSSGHPSSQGQGQSGSGGGGGKLVAPPKIMAQETKVRCIEAWILHFDAVRITGQALLSGPRDKIRTGNGANEGGKIAEEFCVALDELDEEMDSSYKSLVKQGVGVGGWKGKKTGGSTKSWGSRISRSMDKMTNSKNDRLDSSDKYVDLLAHLCGGAQIINDHLLNYTSGECTTPYAHLPEKGYRNIEARLRRTSEFVGAVIVPFVLDDFKQFFLRYLKGGVRYLED